jgi:hypothetical protein
MIARKRDRLLHNYLKIVILSGGAHSFTVSAVVEGPRNRQRRHVSPNRSAYEAAS